MKKITLIAGARPNFMKIAPIIQAIKQYNEGNKQENKLAYRLVHTGQHYDKAMSQSFFEDLHIPEPNINLHCGGGTQAEQTAAIMVAFEKELANHPADLVLVVGDVTSTMACTIVAKKAQTKVAHVEAGIRSFDMTMPEEINRIVTDSLADYFFTTSEIANINLKNIGISPEKIFFVGNVMIDSLMSHKGRFKKPDIWENLFLERGKYIVMTMHRPSNVDEENKLKKVIETIIQFTNDLPILFPMHPRTKKIFEQLNIQHPSLHIVDPLGYLEFNFLVESSKLVITDSGGITEETTVMGIPCITLRENTERPETITEGTNELTGTDPIRIKAALEKIMQGTWKEGRIPPLWDGKASNRIIEILGSIL
jgi:UDP-N-acetylglucosamine 2-epimerase (non-hydrolysing)